MLLIFHTTHLYSSLVFLCAYFQNVNGYKLYFFYLALWYLFDLEMLFQYENCFICLQLKRCFYERGEIGRIYQP